MFTLRVGVGGVAGAFADRDAVPDGDRVGSDEDVFDEQPQDALTFLDGGDFGLGVELGEESFQVGGEFEVGVAVGELGVEGLDLVSRQYSIKPPLPGVSQARKSDSMGPSSARLGCSPLKRQR
jgi:hypothetical protein